MTRQRMPSQAIPTESEQSEWLCRLIEAVTPTEVGAVIVAMAESMPGCETASLLWGNDGEAPLSARL